ncbi:hypothetical protein D3227_28095 [Mesorhizobium waimense]|uniref:Uncharacterized protein n=1 Tax=Mesorhizobium waimense TaxID=1300307 RepID=A0A3A5K9V8_9HYPH|nr:hypothetical protein D3227_28095 [Mesorhizobium waimense]
MSVQKEDYRTNRADYLIAKRPNLIDPTKPKKKKLRLHDQRSARLSENPSELSERPTSRR